MTSSANFFPSVGSGTQGSGTRWVSALSLSHTQFPCILSSKEESQLILGKPFNCQQ